MAVDVSVEIVINKPRDEVAAFASRGGVYSFLEIARGCGHRATPPASRGW
ncbi:MAG: hypothetical protein IIC91_00785 [Chloroflexi bacterium]|nr:hypothetical protein [Chloroflexota bacterium]MCH8162365.1 hypothetical protein [Chloroflexota bacterium]